MKDQATETARLADVAERQLMASTTPVLRIQRRGSGHGDMYVRDDGETLVVWISNRGPVAAHIEVSPSIGPPNCGGELHQEDLDGATLGPEGAVRLLFPCGAAALQRWRSHEAKLRIPYEAVGSGQRYRTTARLKRVGEVDGEDGWRIIAENIEPV